MFYKDLTSSSSNEWIRWRDAYEGGRHFVNHYLKKFSARESDSDFEDRKTFSYSPSEARVAVDQVKNAIFQRVGDVSRIGGPKSYAKAILGENGGVDYNTNTMGSFIGNEVLSELLVMGKTGVLVDNFTEEQLGLTEKDKGNLHPFFSVYQRENILAYGPNKSGKRLEYVRLQEYFSEMEDHLTESKKTRIREMWLTPEGYVHVRLSEEGGKKVLVDKTLSIQTIPFVMFELENSLMRDIADMQVALLNIESSDIAFIQKANFPFFYEFYDADYEQVHYKSPTVDGTGATSEDVSSTKEVAVGTLKGKRYPKGITKEPGFINPNPETLIASMKKSEALKADIRRMLHMNLESLGQERTAEAGLSAIGLELQRGEQVLANIWAEFESGKAARVDYPETYDLKTDEDKREEAKDLNELAETVPSPTFRREVKKLIVQRIHGTRLPKSLLDKMYKEIDAATVVTSNPNIILSAHKEGLIGDADAATAMGLGGEETVEQARKDRAERLALVIEAQGGEMNPARGVNEMTKGVTSEDEKQEKQRRGEEDKSDIGAEQK